MSKRLVQCAVFGGICVFLWGMFSWMVLPWHQTTIKKFQNEESVAQVIRENAPEKGVYLLPDVFSSEHSARDGEGKEIVAGGPVVFAAIQPFGVEPNMPASFFIALLIDIVGAYLITWFVMQIRAEYWRHVFCITLIGFIVGFLGLLPAWNWWNFSIDYVLVEGMDFVISWFLAGLIIAKIYHRKALRKKR